MPTIAVSQLVTVAKHIDIGCLGESRDEAWFTALYEETLDSVHRYATVLVRNPDLADDVVADTFLRVWRARASFRGEGSALAWVLTIARNCALNALKARREEIDLALVDEPEDRQLAEPGADIEEFESIQSALSLLTPEQQQVIFLRFFKEMPHDAVARALGRNPAAVRAIQFRALARLRRALETNHAR
jgi:RNA polymerase sigma-70 factor, ECF subfamily